MIEHMTTPIATIDTYMTISPHTVGAEQTLAYAHELLREHRIRHLPVLRGGQLIGMLTERDLALIEKLADVDPRTLKIEEAMTADVYTVAPEARLDVVVSEMAAKKLGSAVVVQSGKVAGIFTMVDACNALVELLHAPAVQRNSAQE
jgi:acetoin utilization protein AcuB